MAWQPVGVVYPDIEEVLCGEFADGAMVSPGKLRPALAARTEPYAQDVYVANKMPTTRRDRMVIARRDGGTQGEMRDRPRVTLRVWATSESDANNLAALVMALASTFADGDPIIAVPADGRSGPSPVPDGSGQPQRLMSVEFHTRGVQA